MMSRNVTLHRVTTYVIDKACVKVECHDVTQEEFMETAEKLRNLA